MREIRTILMLSAVYEGLLFRHDTLLSHKTILPLNIPLLYPRAILLRIFLPEVSCGEKGSPWKIGYNCFNARTL